MRPDQPLSIGVNDPGSGVLGRRYSASWVKIAANHNLRFERRCEPPPASLFRHIVAPLAKAR